MILPWKKCFTLKRYIIPIQLKFYNSAILRSEKCILIGHWGKMQWIPAYIYDILQRTLPGGLTYWFYYLTIAKCTISPAKTPWDVQVIISAQNWNIFLMYTWNISMETFYIETKYPNIHLPYYTYYYKMVLLPWKMSIICKKAKYIKWKVEKNEKIIIK